jgi:Ran GTPase-activating protein (RanGAP) involved in mRNA processing and transport
LSLPPTEEKASEEEVLGAELEEVFKAAGAGDNDDSSSETESEDLDNDEKNFIDKPMEQVPS